MDWRMVGAVAIAMALFIVAAVVAGRISGLPKKHR